MQIKEKKDMVFAVLNLVQGGLVGLIPLFVSSREPLVNWLLGGIAVVMILAGPLLLFGRRIGRRLVVVACLLHVAAGTVFAALVASSASYLYTIYGHHGQSVGMLAFVVAIVVLIVFWLIPIHELHYLKKTEERRP
jgi:MFS family permease